MKTVSLDTLPGKARIDARRKANKPKPEPKPAPAPVPASPAPVSLPAPQVHVTVPPDPALAAALEKLGKLLDKASESKRTANRWDFTIARDHNGLIKEITATRG